MSIKQNGVMIAGGNQLDSVPTSGSTNPVSSGGVYTALAGKVNTGHEVIEFQAPTAGNNYTWYRKYADGWVEQGGILQAQTISAGYGASQTLTLPITMADANFTVTFGDVSGHQAFQSVTISRTTTGGTVYQMNRSGSGSASIQFSYVVSGVAAS